MSADDMRVITGPLRLERLREELRKVAIGADKTRFVMRDLASQRERIAENTVNKIKEVKKDHSYSTRPPEKRQEVLRDLERTLASAKNNAKIFKQVEIELGDIAIAANKAELRLKDYAGAFINVSGSKDAIDSKMVNTLDTAWRKVGEAKDIYDEFITQLPVKYLLDLPLKEISAAKETLDKLRDGRLRLIKKAESIAEALILLGPDLAKRLLKRFASGEGGTFYLKTNDIAKILRAKLVQTAIAKLKDEYRVRLFQNAWDNLTEEDILCGEIDENYEIKDVKIEFLQPERPLDKSDKADLFYSFHILHLDAKFVGKINFDNDGNTTTTFTGQIEYRFWDDYSFTDRKWAAIPGLSKVADDLFWTWQEYGSAAAFSVEGNYLETGVTITP